MTSDDEREGEVRGLRAETRGLRDENAALRLEVQYGKEALALVQRLRDRVVSNVDEIDDLIVLIRQQMAEMGETGA